jgi:hypothetical protein
MPAKSGAQRRLFGMALACKRGNKKACASPAVKKIVKSMSESQIRDYAKKKK